MIYILSSISVKIEEWNEKLNSFFANNFDSPFFGTIALMVLFEFVVGSWVVWWSKVLIFLGFYDIRCDIGVYVHMSV